ncbi:MULTISPECIES: hypothetical protein [Brevundimonas]|uniref:hypothetical protein n=1 Tax=Brevundimonas TaxID=41275 RepID=UPI000F012F5B|nr:hypothetical protein [Brevundimonas lutea]
MTIKTLARGAVLAMALALSATPVVVQAQSNDGMDRRVRIINDTGRTIMYFYASRQGVDSWEEDILGSDILEDGDSVTANIDDGSRACRYDFKAVFEDGQSLERYNINVCEITTYTYTR